MKNPFISYSESEKCEYLSSLCSINKTVVAKVPVRGIDDEIEGKKANDIFCTKLIIDDIKKLSKQYNIDLSHYNESELPKFLDYGLECSDVITKQACRRIARKFGKRLGLILLTLKTGLPENRLVRSDWNDEHWKYWSEIENVVLTGGLASGVLGRYLKEEILFVFDMAGVKPYNIVLFENGTYVGTMGCAVLIENKNSTNVVFDFGQTNIKRSIVKLKNGEVADVNILKSLPSENMALNNDYDMAFSLHKYLLNVLYRTFRECEKVCKLNDEVVISIASYTVGGILNDERGGYAKLCLLSRNYGELLSNELSGALHRSIRVKLVHDGTANALYFKDYKNAVCVSIGTAFGVGYPEINLY